MLCAAASSGLAHGLFARGKGFFDQAAVDKHLAEISVGHAQLRVEGDRGAEGFDSLVAVSLFAQRVAEIVLSHGQARPHDQGRAEFFDGFLVAAESLQGQAEIVGRFRVVGPQAQRRLATVNSLLVLAQAAMRLGQIRMIGPNSWPQGDGLTDQLDGAGRIATLVVQHAKQVQGIRMVGLPGEQVGITARRIGRCPDWCNCQQVAISGSITRVEFSQGGKGMHSILLIPTLTSQTVGFTGPPIRRIRQTTRRVGIPV